MAAAVRSYTFPTQISNLALDQILTLAHEGKKPEAETLVLAARTRKLAAAGQKLAGSRYHLAQAAGDGA